MSYSGKTAFITGGAIGFGRAFARALTARGASVMLADIDLAAAEAAADELREQGHHALAVYCDVADPDAVATAVAQTVEHCGGIDILINNAGRHLTKYSQVFQALTREEIRGLFDVNLHGVIQCTLACRDSLASRKGSIVNISSIAGYAANSPYGVSKLAVRGLTIAFAEEFAALGIRVNAIAPGLIATENALADLPQALVEDFTHNKQLVKRLGQMEDIVQAMLYLTSEEASFVTGETLKVAGGFPLGIY
jgi:NAD(P)-dependent dehydrogenase (short-subunit alcohol dehydrogenase family)